MSETLLAAERYRETYGNRWWRMRNLYKIRTKQRKLIHLQPNPIQLMLEARADRFTNQSLPLRMFVLKYRQGGVSTWTDILMLDDTLFNRNTVSGILADKRENLSHLWEIVRTAYKTMPERLRPKIDDDNKSTMSFPGLNSRMIVSLSIKSTALHNLHISEWAFCDDSSINESLGGTSPQTHIIGETTPNGVGNDAYITYHDALAGVNGYDPIFVPWYLQQEYRIPLNGAPSPVRTKDEAALPLDDEQVMFRRIVGGKLKRDFLKYYPEDDKTCWLMSGHHYFDQAKVLALLREAKESAKVTPPVEETDEFVAWEKPEPGCLYVAGADVAEGIDVDENGGRDYSVMAIYNVTKRRQAARYRARIGVDVFYKKCDELGRRYNMALIAVERNNHGHAVLMGLMEACHYPNLFAEKPDKRIIGAGTPQVRWGWSTTQQNKSLVIDQFRIALEGDFADDEHNFQPEFHVFDQEMLRELLTFEEVDGKLSAAQGKHDDCVMAWGIGYQMYMAARRREKLPQGLGIIIAGQRESA